jgi:hypothetical protein
MRFSMSSWAHIKKKNGLFWIMDLEILAYSLLAPLLWGLW